MVVDPVWSSLGFLIYTCLFAIFGKFLSIDLQIVFSFSLLLWAHQWYKRWIFCYCPILSCGCSLFLFCFVFSFCFSDWVNYIVATVTDFILPVPFYYWTHLVRFFHLCYYIPFSPVISIWFLFITSISLLWLSIFSFLQQNFYLPLEAFLWRQF